MRSTRLNHFDKPQTAPAFAISAALLLMMTACSTNLESTDKLPFQGSTPVITDPPPQPETGPVVEGTRFLKTKAGPELKATFEQLTGINLPNTPAIASLTNYFNENKGNLPVGDEAAMVSDVNLIAIQNYADEFCWQMLSNGAARNQFFGSTIYASTGVSPRDSILDTPEKRSQLVELLVSKFWRPSPSAERQSEVSILKDLIESLYTASTSLMNSNNAEQGKRIVSAACMATLSAPTVIFH